MENQTRKNVYTIATALVLTPLIIAPFFYPRIQKILGKSRDEVDSENFQQSRQKAIHSPITPSHQTSAYTQEDAKRDLASLTLEISTPYTLRQIKEIAERGDNELILPPPYQGETFVYIGPRGLLESINRVSPEEGLRIMTTKVKEGSVTIYAGRLPDRKEKEFLLYPLVRQESQ